MSSTAVLTPTPQRRSVTSLILAGIGELLITLGVLLFLFAGWQLWWTDVMNVQDVNHLTEELHDQWKQPAPPASDPATTIPAEPTPDVIPVKPAPGQAFAFMHIPKFGEGWGPRPVLEGVSTEDLKKSAGHYSDTALPGEIGNFSVAGHRTTYGKPFNQIHTLQPGDPIVVETEKAWFTYTVREHRIVTPNQIEVIAPVPDRPGVAPTERLLTLTSCHPMFEAHERYIVHAALQSWQPKWKGKPAALGG